MAAASPAGGGAGPLSVSPRTTEYAEQHLGTDVRHPRLSWAVTAPGHGATQSAYQVLIATRPDLLSVGSADVWDSGRVESSRSLGVQYGGPELAPRTVYSWSVQLWDGGGRASGWSEPTTFETGLLDEGFGAATWIGAEPALEAAALDVRGASWIWSPGATSGGAPTGTRWFRGRLALPAGIEVASAFLVMTADDDYTAYLAGAAGAVGTAADRRVGPPRRPTSPSWRRATSAAPSYRRWWPPTEAARPGCSESLWSARATGASWCSSRTVRGA